MNSKILKGIAFILFGILLCLCDTKINHTVLRDFSDFPFWLIGLIFGIIGITKVILRKDEK